MPSPRVSTRAHARARCLSACARRARARSRTHSRVRSQIELDAPEAGATHFQCVYMRVKTPNSALAKANALAQKALMHVAGDEGDGGGALELAPYLPHLSLVYGGTLEQAERAAIVDELRGGATDATPTVRAPTEGFVANEVSLWYTPVEDQSTASWREVAKVRMEGVDSG